MADILLLSEKRKGGILTVSDVPPDIILVPYEEAGIDPYTFLDLPK